MWVDDKNRVKMAYQRVGSAVSSAHLKKLELDKAVSYSVILLSLFEQTPLQDEKDHHLQQAVASIFYKDFATSVATFE